MGRPSTAYDEAVDEALCIGWIDRLIKRLAEERYARKLTPRKPDSSWSAAAQYPVVFPDGNGYKESTILKAPYGIAHNRG